MCEPRLGILIQGRIRNLGLSTTKGRFFSRFCRVHPMKLSRGASFHAAVEKPHGERPAVAVVDGVAHLGADQGLVSEIVVARATNSFQSLLWRVPRRRGAGRADGPCRGSSGPGTAALRCPARRRSARAGSAVPAAPAGRSGRPCAWPAWRPWPSSLRPPSGLNQPMRRQNSFDSIWRFNGAARRSARAAAPFPPAAEVAAVITALDRAGHAGAMSSRLRSSASTMAATATGRPVVCDRSAHAASHVSSQLRMSMPFIESVPTTEYMIAVNLAPSSLSEPNDSRRPMAGPRNNLSARLLSRGTCGRSTNTLSPSRWAASAAPCPGAPGPEADQLPGGLREQAVERLLQRALRRGNRRTPASGA